MGGRNVQGLASNFRFYIKKKHDKKKDSRLRKLASHDGVSLQVNNLSAEHEGKKKRKTRRFKQEK